MTTKEALALLRGEEVFVTLKPHDNMHCVMSQSGEAIDIEVWNCVVMVDGLQEPDDVRDPIPIGACILDDFEVEDARGCPKVTLHFSTTEHELTDDERAVMDALE